MKIENLKEGQVIKNYKELCKILDIEEEQGNSKVIQMKELERYCETEKNGHSIRIVKIYDKTIEKEIDKRKSGNRSIYIDDISVQILSYLAANKKERIMVDDDERIFLTARQLFQITGMINDRYLPTKKSIEQYIEDAPINIRVQDLDDFYARTEAKMREILKSSLKNLESRFIILLEKRHTVFNGKTRRATTKKEESEILGIKNKIMNSMLSDNVFRKNIGKIFFIGKLPEFYEEVNRTVKEKLNLQGLQYGYAIGCSNRLEENLESYKKEYKHLLEIQMSLNNNFSNFVDRDAKNKYLKMKKEHDKKMRDFLRMITSDDYERTLPPIPPSKNWEDNQIFLNEDLIKLPKK